MNASPHVHPSRTQQLLCLAVLSIVAACSDQPAATSPGHIQPSQEGRNVVLQPGRNRTADDRLTEIALQIPGFGGLAFDAAGDVQVYLTDLGQEVVARPVISALMTGRSKSGEGPGVGTPPIRFVKGRYDWPQLLAWKAQLRGTVLSDPSVTFLDADEGNNRITIGVVNLNDEARVRNLAVSANVLSEAITFVERGRPQLLQNLRQNYSPRIGGLGISWPPFTPSGQLQACTHGPRIWWSPNGAFLTNSHCTGGLDQAFVMNSTQIAQGGVSIGTEYRDEPLFTNGVYGCPPSMWCRNSDAAIITYNSGIVSQFGIAFTGLPPCYLTSCESRLNIQGIVQVTSDDWPIQGQDLNKTGQRSGWTRGPTTSTCTDTNYDTINWPPAGGFITPVMLCQIHVNAFADGGDSGSPVYKRYTTQAGQPGTAHVVGILWGRVGLTMYVSSLSGVSADLGPVTVYP